MSSATAERVADALLWEGYLLYPYRASALKNRMRWQFGVVSPAAAESVDGADSSVMQTECLLEPAGQPMLTVTVRHLQLQRRETERATSHPDEWDAVGELVVDGRALVPWDEAVPHSWSLPALSVAEACAERSWAFDVPGGVDTEPVRDRGGSVVGRWVRRRHPLRFLVHVRCDAVDELRKVRVRIENVTSVADQDAPAREALLARSLISAHTVLSLTGGAFLSPLEPPPLPTAACTNLRTWPVLVGRPPCRDTLLSSPIILSDYPAIAPESPVDLCDGTEIDEILTLRVLTLTEDEKREALDTDARAQAVLASAAGLSADGQARLHGAIRPGRDVVGPASPARSAWEEWLNPAPRDRPTLARGGVPLTDGAVVRLRPGGSADAMDMFLAGRSARVTGIYRDLEDRPHVAVTVDAADAADLQAAYGRYLYFSPDELEVLEDAVVSAAAAAGSPTPRVLVAGIGNIFLGDDGFGSAVVDRLARRPLPECVRVEDYGIRGVHLAHDLLGGGYETVILVDAVARGGSPGTLYVIEPERVAGGGDADAHAMTPDAVLAYVERLGGATGRVLVVGCEPATVDPEMGLSAPVSAALDEAVEMVSRLVSGTAG
jgi:hydrogenase maturation protease